MSFERVKSYFKSIGMIDRVKEFDKSSATVDLAAKAIGCEPELIAKTMSFQLGDKAILIVTAGDAKVDNRKYKDYFGKKAKFIKAESLESIIGHPPGGICPFAVNEDVRIFLDESLKRFDIVYPAAGSENSAVKLNLEELEKYSNSEAWVDVCKEWQIE